MYELINIFPFFDWNSAKKLQKVIFIFTEQTVKKAFTFWTSTRREIHQSKKAQHVDLLTSSYKEYKPKLGAMGKPFRRAGVEYQQCRTRYLKSRGLYI